MDKLFDSGAKCPQFIPDRVKTFFLSLLTLLLRLTCEAGAVDDKDLIASYDQGKCLTVLFTLPWASRKNSVEHKLEH